MEYVTAEEIAGRFGVDVSTVYRWGREDKIPSKVIAGTIRFPRSLLEPTVPAAATATTAPAPQE